MKPKQIFLDAWPYLCWFLLAGYVIIRSLQSSQQIDVTFGAWLGGVVSVFCVLGTIRIVRRRRAARAGN